MKKCPYCAEEIQDQEIKCRHCREWFEKKDQIIPTNERLQKVVSDETFKKVESDAPLDVNYIATNEKNGIVSKDNENTVRASGDEKAIGNRKFIYQRNKVGDAFCLGCRKIVNLKDLYYCKETDEYYHEQCLINPGQRAINEHYTIDPTSITKFLKTMLWIYLGFSVLSMFSEFIQMNLLSAGYFSQTEAESNDTRQRIIAVLYLTNFIVTGIAFLRWIHRANTNCHGFGAQGMKFSPGWSIGYYFIPILCFFRPYQAMKEIWKVSKNPSDWQNEIESPLLGWWWGLWVVASVLGQISFRMSMEAKTIIALKAVTTISIISHIVDIPLCIVAVSLITAIFSNQERFVRKTVQ